VAKSNQWDAYCAECRVFVRKGEGRVIVDPDARRRYTIVCLEHAPDVALDTPKPPEASKLPSIHRDDERYER
jgi:hypothetical protein